MTKVAILGITGMLGSMLWDVFRKTEFDLIGTTRKELDAQIATVEDIEKVLADYDYAINCIGRIKSYIHDDNPLDVEKAIEVNALFPHKLAKAAEKTGTKIIQIATDCVFDGEKGAYLETDKHNATDIYGKTKSLGEVSHHNVLNLRCSIIGKEIMNKTSLLEWFLNQPQSAKVNGFKNHFWNGITTNAFAKICVGIIRNEAWSCGLQHVVPADMINKADMLKVFSKTFNRDDIVITDIDANEAIDRTIKTDNKKHNKELWNNAEYKKIPTIQELINELV